jgi:hypothetical protein
LAGGSMGASVTEAADAGQTPSPPKTGSSGTFLAEAASKPKLTPIVEPQ